MPSGHGLGSNDRFDARFGGASQEVGDTVKAVTVRKGHTLYPHLPRGSAQRLRAVDSPGG